MEVVEVLVGLLGAALESAEACACFVYMVVGLLDAVSAYTGVRAVRTTRRRRALARQGTPPEGRNRAFIAFMLLLPFALLASGIALYALVRWLRQ